MVNYFNFSANAETENIGILYTYFKKLELPNRVNKYFFLFCASLFFLSSQIALADDFKMNCVVQISIPQMLDKSVPPTRVSLLIQTLGNNIFMQIVGPSPYNMKVSTLTTKVMTGINLTDPKHLGVRTRNKETGQEAELLIDQKKVTLTGYNDVELQKQSVRLLLTGQCILPN